MSDARCLKIVTAKKKASGKKLSSKLSICLGGGFEQKKSKEKLSELEKYAQKPDLWEEADKAQKILREAQQLRESIKACQKLEDEYEDAKALRTLAIEENSQEEQREASKLLHKLAKSAQKMRLETLLREKEDAYDCYLELHAGAGGTESQDWAEMLLRMYSRWAERHGFKIEILATTQGEEAGIKSLVMQLQGQYAYGWLKSEGGVHRLVRISPFDANSRRHTSFCSVGVYPVLEVSAHEHIEAKDLRIDTYRSSGAGGQHVNTTDSAIRITHLPTGIAVQCQSDRSQHRNRANAMAMLQSRLFAQAQEKQLASSKAIRQKGDIAWGHQIRSYVLHPYRLVKDLRSGIEVGNAQSVLDGNIDSFLEAALASDDEQVN